MSFELPPLPYPKDGLAPYISEETVNYHYGKHHQAYVNKLNALIAKPENAEFAEMDLEEIIRNSDGGIFNNAAQIWNHTFYWNGMKPNPKGEDNRPVGDLAIAIDKKYGSFDEFKDQFAAKATSLFGSGWTWLILDKNNKLDIINTPNAETPISDPDITPLMTCDVWEHAYYLDTQNLRPKYVANFWELVNWEQADKNLMSKVGE